FGHVDVKPSFAYSNALWKAILRPELAGSKGLKGLRCGVVFKRVARTQTHYGDVPLAKVAVHRGRCKDLRREVLRISFRSLYYLAAGFAYPNVVNRQF